MPEMLLKRITDASAWIGSEMQQRDDLIYQLSDGEIGELVAAMREVKKRGLDVLQVTRDDFVLPGFGETLAEMLHELNHGRGFLLIHGFPRGDYTEEECGIVLWGIGTHFGRAVSQNAQGDLLGHIRDTGGKLSDPRVRGYQTNAALPFHSDGSDIVGLFCLETAKEGGRSSVISSMAVHNRLLEMRPDLLEVLHQPFCYDRRGEAAGGQKPYYEAPVFGYQDGTLSCRYIGGYIQSAQRLEGVPRLTSKQLEALALMDELTEAEEMRISVQLEPGDMEFASNYTVLHARGAFEDWPEPERKRHILRLWLAVDHPRSLPPALGGRQARNGITPSGKTRGDQSG